MISKSDNAGIFVSNGANLTICNTTLTKNKYGIYMGRKYGDYTETKGKVLVCNSIFYDNIEADFVDSTSLQNDNSNNLKVFNSVYKTWKFKAPNYNIDCSQENPLLEPKYKENEDWIEYYIPQSGSSAINLANRNLVTEDFLTKFDDGSFLYNLMSSLYYNLNFNRANYFDSLLNYDQIGNKRKIENGRYTAGSIDYNTGSIYEKFATVKDFEVFPNPTVDKIHLQFNLLNSDVLEISLFDILGKTIKTFINNSFFDIGEHCIDLDLSNIISGHYYLNITNSKNNNFIQPIKIEK